MIESTLSEYSKFFTIAGVIEDMIRWILFKIVCLLTYISDALEGIMDKIYSLNHFFENKQVEAIYNSFKPVFWIILTLAIVYIAYKMVIDREFKGERIFQNFILSSMVILALPMFMTSLEKITTGSINVLNETKIQQSTTTARSIIKDGLSDLSYLESQNFKLNGYGNNNKVATNNINSDNILKIDINSTMSSGSFLNPTHEIYSKKLVLDENGNEKVVKLEKKFFNLIQEEYYRFNIDYLIVIVSLLCLVLTFILTSIKIARIIVELAFKKIFAMTLAFGDIASGQKLKAVLKDILSSFAIIFTTALLLKIYTIGTSWVGTLNANEIVKIIFMIALSLMVIDAPNIIERILGIDAGIKSGWSLLAGAYAGAKTMGEMAKSIGGMASATNKAMKNATGTLVGAGASAKGMYDGFKGKTLEEEMNSSNSNSSVNSKGKYFDSADGSVSNDLAHNDSKDSLSEQRENENSSAENINDNISSGYGEYNSLSSDMNSSNGFDTSSSSDIENGTLESDMNSNSEFGTSSSSDIENGTLESDMNSSSEFGTSSSSDIENGTLESDMNSSSEFGTSSSSGSSIENGTLESSMNSNSEFGTSSSSGSSIETGTLESSMNSSSEFGTSSSSGSSIETGTLESNIKSNSNKNIGGKNISSSDIKSNRNERLENGLKNKIGSQKSKSENVGSINKNSMSDKNILKNSSQSNTRTLGKYAKDKVVESIGSSRQGENVKKHYQMGVKAGNKLNSSFKDIKDIKERKGK